MSVDKFDKTIAEMVGDIKAKERASQQRLKERLNDAVRNFQKLCRRGRVYPALRKIKDAESKDGGYPPLDFEYRLLYFHPVYVKKFRGYQFQAEIGQSIWVVDTRDKFQPEEGYRSLVKIKGFTRFRGRPIIRAEVIQTGERLERAMENFQSCLREIEDLREMTKKSPTFHSAGIMAAVDSLTAPAHGLVA